MKLLIDIQCLQSSNSKNRGVGRYAKEIITRLIKNKKDKDIIYLLLNGGFVNECIELRDYFKQFIDEQYIITWTWYLYIPNATQKENSIKKLASFFREKLIESLKPDIVWSPNFQEGFYENGIVTSIGNESNLNFSKIATLYDVSPLVLNAKFDKTESKWYKKMLKYARDCQYIFTVSNYSKKQISHYLNIDPSKIYVTYCGIDNSKFIDKKVKKRNYFLYFGGYDKYKNIDYLINAYKKLPNEIFSKYKLILLGCSNKQDYYYYKKLITRNNLDSKVTIIKYVTDDILVKYLNECRLFIYPSLAEGFGLPPVEAISCGATSLVSNTTSLPEIISANDCLFDPYNYESLINKIVKVINNPDFELKIRNNQIMSIKKFTWDNAFKVYFDILNKISQTNKIKNSITLKEYIKKERIHIKEQDLHLIAKSITDSLIQNNKIHIYVDISGTVFATNVTGIQRVCINLINSLKRIVDDNYTIKPIYYDNNLCIYRECANINGNYKIDINKDPQIPQFNQGDFFLMPDLNIGVVTHLSQFFRQLMARGIKVIGFVYDLIPIRFPETCLSFDFSKEFKKYISILSTFSCVITDSRTVLNQYKDFLNTNGIKSNPSLKLSYFYPGCDFKMPCETYDNKKFIYFEHKLNFLIVSTIEPRKMHDQVLSAFEILWEKGFNANLIFVGRIGWKSKSIINHFTRCKYNNEKFFWFNNLEDDDLNKIYKISTCIIFASLEEGYGLSIAEGAKYNKHLILRNIPVFKEIAKNDAFYFNSITPKGLSEEILKWHQLYKKGQLPESKRLNFNTWDEAAQQLLQNLNIDHK